MKNKPIIKDFILPGIAFILIFLTLLSLLTVIYLPKWSTKQDGGQMAGFYKEPDQTIDVLFLGSCNMYTSIAPLLMYEEFGITGYAFTCPDQELSTSYYYLKEALKTQSPKAVVLESLFLTHFNTAKRERYNRYAFDYMPLNANKIQMAYALAARESEFMKQHDSTTPDPLLTFFGYIFPILRYHSRTDLKAEDVTFFTEDNLYNVTKGNSVRYTQPLNQDFYQDVSQVFNGDGINDIAKEYFPKIKALCDELNIPLVVMKSPNFARWGQDDTYTANARKYVESFHIPFVDMHAEPYNNFLAEDYSHESVLNIYGDRKLTHTIAQFLVDNYDLAPTQLSADQAAQWDACVAEYYQRAEDSGACITPGELAYINNQDGATLVTWNDCGSTSYELYRSLGHSDAFEKIATVSGDRYTDTDVTHGQGYTYYIVPCDGAKANQKSQTAYNIYVKMPKNFRAVNQDGAAFMNWSSVKGASYRIHRLSSSSYSYELYHTLDLCKFTNSKVVDGRLYTYRLTAFIEEDGTKYFSEAAYASVVPQKTPYIKNVSISDSGAVTLYWDALKNQKTIQVWRKSSKSDKFVLYNELSASATKYTNSANLEPGVTYSYKLVAVAENYGLVTSSAESNVVTVTAITPKK